jgi:hypothetical protein
MVSCKRAAELIALALDSKLSLWQRLALAVHLCGCLGCRRFRRQLRAVEQACCAWARSDRMTEATAALSLTGNARERIRRALLRASAGEQQ